MTKVYYSQGQLVAAKEAYSNAIVYIKLQTGEISLAYVNELMLLRIIYMGDERYEDVSTILLAVIELKQRVLHPDLAEDYNLLGVSYLYQDRLQEAADIFQTVLQIQITEPEARDTYAIFAYRSLAMISYLSNQVQIAKELCLVAIEIAHRGENRSFLLTHLEDLLELISNKEE